MEAEGGVEGGKKGLWPYLCWLSCCWSVFSLRYWPGGRQAGSIQHVWLHRYRKFVCGHVARARNGHQIRTYAIWIAGSVWSGSGSESGSGRECAWLNWTGSSIRQLNSTGQFFNCFKLNFLFTLTRYQVVWESPPLLMPHARVHLHFFLFDMSFDAARHVVVQTSRQIEKVLPLCRKTRRIQSSVLHCDILSKTLVVPQLKLFIYLLLQQKKTRIDGTADKEYTYT